MDRGAEFSRWKAQSLNKADLSRKGSVDEDAVAVVELLNSREEFFTTSSCAGRILLLDGVRLPGSPCPCLLGSPCFPTVLAAYQALLQLVSPLSQAPAPPGW